MEDRGASSRATVLLLEPEPLAQTGISGLLTEAGFEVIEANEPDEVWSKLELLPNVDVLVANLDTPNDAKGMELAQKVHERWPSVGLVITSRCTRHLKPSDIPDSGSFLPHPIPVAALLHEVNAFVTRKR